MIRLHYRSSFLSSSSSSSSFLAAAWQNCSQQQQQRWLFTHSTTTSKIPLTIIVSPLRPVFVSGARHQLQQQQQRVTSSSYYYYTSSLAFLRQPSSTSILFRTFTTTAIARSNTGVTAESAAALAATATTTTTTTTDGAKSSNKKWWRRLAWLVKYTRIPFIVLGVYGLGYQQGIIDYAREPQLLQQGLILHALSGLGVTSMDQVDVLRLSSSSAKRDDNRRRHGGGIMDDAQERAEEEERRQPPFWMGRRRKTSMFILQRTNTINCLTNQQVAVVGHRIVQVAQDFVRSELAKAQKELEQQELEQQQQQQKSSSSSSLSSSTSKTSPTASSSSQEKTSDATGTATTMISATVASLSVAERVEFWSEAQRRMEGGDWQYILVDTPIPNAFVAEVLPRRIFVTSGLLESLATNNNNNVNMRINNKRKIIANGFVSNADELALVLGHEVSHLILGHLSMQNQVELFLRTLEVLLLSLDPTEGLISLYMVTILAGIRAALSAAYSREDEREADQLGIILCAMAGWDLPKACQVFYKMAQAEGGGSNSLLSTHPPTLERYEFLCKKAKELSEAKE